MMKPSITTHFQQCSTEMQSVAFILGPIVRQPVNSKKANVQEKSVSVLVVVNKEAALPPCPIIVQVLQPTTSILLRLLSFD